MAALTVATLLLWPLATVPTTILLCGCGVTMLSPSRITRPKGFGLFLFVCWPVVVIASQLMRR